MYSRVSVMCGMYRLCVVYVCWGDVCKCVVCVVCKYNVFVCGVCKCVWCTGVVCAVCVCGVLGWCV